MNKGYTLIELLIVVAILGIIGVVGVPQYLGYADNSRTTLVKNNLRTIYMKQQDYYQRNSEYYSTGGACSDATSDINTNLFDGANVIVNDKFYYCITRNTVDDFSAQAREISGSRQFTINQLNQTNF